MRKYLKLLFVCMAFCLFLLTMAACADSGGNTGKGIEVWDGGDSSAWETDDHRLILKKDGLRLSGTAEADLRIVCREGVSSLEIEDLKQGDHDLILSPSSWNSKPVTVKVSGENELAQLRSQDRVILRGRDSDSVLKLTGGIDTYGNLQIKDAAVSGSFIKSFGGIFITGSSRITLGGNSGLSEENLTARIQAGKKIFVNLKKGGCLTVSKAKRLFPIFADKIELGENSKIAVPENGYIKGQDTPYGPNCHFAFNEKGEEAEELKIVCRDTAD